MSKACNFAFQSSSQSPTSQDKPQVLSADDSAIVDDPEFVSTLLFNYQLDIFLFCFFFAKLFNDIILSIEKL